MVPISWTESGLFYPTSRDLLKGGLTSVNWLVSTNKLSLAGTTATPDFFGTTDPSTWTNTAECTGTNWPTGGVAYSANGMGTATFTQGASAPHSTLSYGAGNVSVATTTISNAAFGAYLYAAAQTPAAMFMGIWFGGTGYTTVAGTFAITWSGGVIATITCAA